MDIQTQGFLSINQMTDRYLNKNVGVNNTDSFPEISFRDVLRDKLSNTEDKSVKFSKHALSRLESRNIDLSENVIKRLNEGTKKAESKGIKDSLVIVDRLAFIVNVPNNTVITAMDADNTDENVFTNINGAVIV